MPLVETDLDGIFKRDPTAIIEKTGCASSCLAREDTSQHSPGQDHQDRKLDDSVGRTTPHVYCVCNSGARSPQMALKLAFTLPSSCYATMAIRELLKSSTSVAFQKTLNS